MEIWVYTRIIVVIGVIAVVTVIIIIFNKFSYVVSKSLRDKLPAFNNNHTVSNKLCIELRQISTNFNNVW